MGSTISAIAAGIVKEVNTSAPAEPFISIADSKGVVITYRYVTASVSQGSPVTLLQSIGTASNSNVDIEMEKSAGVWCNPLYDCMGPFAAYTPPPEQHPNVDPPILIDFDSGAPINISTPIGRRHFSILANIEGTVYQPNLSSPPAVGVNEVGYFIQPVEPSTYPSFGISGTFDPYRLTQAYQLIESTKLFSVGLPYSTSRSAEGGPFFYIATNFVRGTSLVTGFASNDFQDGLWDICVRASDTLENGHRTSCSRVTFDRTAPTTNLLDGNGAPLTTGVSSLTVINVSGYDFFGLANISISSGTPITYPVSGRSAVQQFSGLTDGVYTATVVDLAGNSSQVGFQIQTQDPRPINASAPNLSPLPEPIPTSTNPVLGGVSTAPICEVAFNGQSLTIASSDSVTAVHWGGFPLLPAGSYTSTITDCAGNRAVSNMSVTGGSSGSIFITVSDSGSGDSQAALLSVNPSYLASSHSSITVVSAHASGAISFDTKCLQMDAPGPCTDVTPNVSRLFQGTPDISFPVVNSTNTSPSFGISVEYRLFTPEGLLATSGTVGLNDTYTGHATFDATAGQFGQLYLRRSPDGFASGKFAFAVQLNPWTLILQAIYAILRQVLRMVGQPYLIGASDAYFTTPATINISVREPLADTTTLSIYSFNSVSWDSTTIVDQQVSMDANGVVSASGTVSRGGIYGLFFKGVDVTAPTSTISVQGSSSTFDGAVILSTDSYLILTATDVAAGGYASQVSTTWYRIDGTSSTIFSAYSSSIPTPIGRHYIEYKAQDYAGNYQPTKTLTFLASAGTVLQENSSLRAPSGLMAGSLGSGAEMEILSRVDDAYTLIASSADKTGMVYVTNVRQVGIGVAEPQGTLDVSSSSVAIQLRAGNSASPSSDAQIAFGYYGNAAYRHALRTEHSTATDSNRMDFLLWNAGTGSTTTLASRMALSLQGIGTASNGSFHVVPAGQPDTEVEVSNGSSVGGGTIQYAHYQSPSSRRFKTDISYLSEKDEDRAAREVAELRHARFRYKALRNGTMVDDPAQPLLMGLIYEDAPESIRDSEGALSSNERLANAELALKAAMRGLEKLQARYAELKARRRP